jgi:hypothetical protein
MVAAPNYLVDGLITSVRTKYIQPTSQNLFVDTDIVLFLDECLRDVVLPLILSAQETYFVSYFDQAVTGAASYTIPQRSSAGALMDICFVDPSGIEMPLQQLDTVQISQAYPNGVSYALSTGGYYLKDDQVILYPAATVQSTANTLRMKFYRRPNNLTLAANCGQITAINGSIVTLNAVDSSWATTTTFDVIQNFPQFKSISDGLAITLISNLNITLASVPTGLAVGMYLCPTGMSCIPQIPYEGFSFLIQSAIERLAESLGDTQGAQIAAKRAEKLGKAFLQIISPRVQKGTKKVMNPNNRSRQGNMGYPYFR